VSDGPATRRQPALSSLFALEQVDELQWRGDGDVLDLPQLFGGQLVGQSLVAAGLSSDPGLRVHSAHTSFLRPGTPGEPIRYAVEVLHSGRSRAVRDVSAFQGDRLLCRTLVSASADDQEGIEHVRPAPAFAPPEDAVPLAVMAEDDGGLGPWWEQFDAVEIRIAPYAGLPVPHSATDPALVWMRTTQPLPDDPLVHRAAVAYASDLMLMSTAVSAHGVPVGHESTLAREFWGISLDHTIWFHDRARADEWLLFEQVSPTAHAGRALIQAAVFDAAGEAVAQVAQEGLIRRQR
jgi:acyl-CoA thioesterase II